MAKMANVKGEEDSLLVENPWPVPSQDPGLAPPPYSSSNRSQPEACRPVPPPPTDAPGPVQVPMPEDPAIYNPMGQVTDELPSSQTANSSKKCKGCCRYLKICSPIGTIGFVVLVSLRFALKQGYSSHPPSVLPESLQKSLDQEFLREAARIKKLQQEREQLQEAFRNDYVNQLKHPFNHANYRNAPAWNEHNSRYRRAEPEDLKDYDFFESIDQPFFDKLFKPEKSLRQRRDLETSSKKMNLGIRKKKYHKAKKFTS